MGSEPGAHPGESEGRGSGSGSPSGLSAAKLAVSLEGRLPCVQCGYDLRGVSILGVCPECGTAVRATLLAVVDPLAAELRPISHQRLVATGLLVWVGSFCVCAVVVGGCLIRQVIVAWNFGEAVGDPTWLAWVVGVLVVLAGVGAALLARPHDRVARSDTLMVWIAVALHAPLAATGVMLSGVHPVGWGSRVGTSSIGPLAVAWEPGPDRSVLRLVAGLMGLGIIVCMRPVARVLVARSLAIRTGRVDRQTMLATAAAIVVVMVGDLLGVAGRSAPAGVAEWMLLGAVTVVGFGAVLLGLGLFSSLVDSVRIARAIVRPGPSMQQVIHGPKGQGGEGDGRAAR